MVQVRVQLLRTRQLAQALAANSRDSNMRLLLKEKRLPATTIDRRT